MRPAISAGVGRSGGTGVPAPFASSVWKLSGWSPGRSRPITRVSAGRSFRSAAVGRVAGDRPLRPVVRDDRHLVAAPDAEVRESGATGVHLTLELGVRHPAPVAAHLGPEEVPRGMLGAALLAEVHEAVEVFGHSAPPRRGVWRPRAGRGSTPPNRGQPEPTMRTFLAVLLAVPLLLAYTSPATAREVAGVTLPETTSASGKTLILNGAGLRTRFFFKVYVIGLYLERPATDAGAVLGTDSVRRAVVHTRGPVVGPEIVSARGGGCEQRAGDAATGLKDRLERFESMFPAVEAGDTL